MLSTSERSSASLARSRAARSPVATRAASTCGLERDAHHVVCAGIERRAQLMRRVEIDADHDMRSGQLGTGTHRGDQRRTLLRVGHHDLSGAIGDQTNRCGGLRDPQQTKPGDGQHRPGVLGKLLQPEQHYAVAFTDKPVEDAGTARLRVAGPLVPANGIS